MKTRFAFILLLFLLVHIGHGQNFQDDLTTPPSKYRVSAKWCSKITHSSGSIIYIPDGAFDLSVLGDVDSVDIYYRELYSPLDMIAHNIPMNFTLMGKSFFLESNGMFDIWCRSGEETVNIHEDRSIEVRMAISPEDFDIRMEGFYFEPDSRQWESYTSRLGLSAVNENDNDLWGSDAIRNEELILEDEDGTLWATGDSVRRVAFQAMEIFDFGLYNYDRIIENEIYVSVKPRFVDEKGEELTSNVYIVYDEINSVFEYPEYTWEKDFSIIQGKSYKMFTIDDEGIISSLADLPDLKEIAGSEYTFRLNTNKKAPSTKQELASLTGIR